MAAEVKSEKKEKRERKSATTETQIALVQSQEIKNWLDDLYDVSKLKDEDLYSFYELLRYKGFERNEVLNQLAIRIPDKNVAIQTILVAALQGPVRAAKTKLTNGQTLAEMGIIHSGQKGTKNLSVSRINAATADLAAYYLKKLNVPKRLDHPCPAWLQFPAAGAIKLPEVLRQQHKDFAAKFSVLIGGIFNEQIYMTMVHNSYLNENLKLFD
jgi:hypothetical protein